MATATPRTDVKEMDDHIAIEMEPVSAAGRKRRGSRRRGGFREQGVNSASPVPPTAPQGPLGGRRRTRKSKGKKRSTRRR
jgi:hypothetical protein